VDSSRSDSAPCQALGEEGAPTGPGAALDYGVRHLLIDEFQDTSRLQFACWPR